MTEDAPLTEKQQLLMAYVDDELDPARRAEFEQTMRSDPELAMEVVKMKNLIDLSNSMAVAEPSDHEIRRFWSRFYNRTEWQLGWVLLVLGLMVLTGEALYLLVSSDLRWDLKLAVICVAAGAGLLLWNTLRLKLRTSHYDRYRGVMR